MGFLGIGESKKRKILYFTNMTATQLGIEKFDGMNGSQDTQTVMSYIRRSPSNAAEIAKESGMSEKKVLQIIQNLTDMKWIRADSE